jgi:hypothetical protein
MRHLPASVLKVACLAIIALTAAAASGAPLRAQGAVRNDTMKSATAPRHAAAASTASAGSTAPPPRSLSQRVFDTPWVLFPTRLTIVIVLLAVAVMFSMGGFWGAVRLAHLLRHLEWKEPPRRWKRGELGAAGATLGWEFEDRTTKETGKDAKRDQQILLLQQNVTRLSKDHTELLSVFVNVLKGTSGSSP